MHNDGYIYKETNLLLLLLLFYWWKNRFFGKPYTLFHTIVLHWNNSIWWNSFSLFIFFCTVSMFSCQSLHRYSKGVTVVIFDTFLFRRFVRAKKWKDECTRINKRKRRWNGKLKFNRIVLILTLDSYHIFFLIHW